MENINEKTGNSRFDKTLLIIHVGLLICAIIVDFIQFGLFSGCYRLYGGIRGCFVWIVSDVILSQKYFSPFCGCFLGWFSRKKSLKYSRIFMDCAGLAIAILMTLWSGFIGMLAAVEGRSFPTAFFIGFLSLALLLVKSIVDGVISICDFISRRKLKKSNKI